MRAEEAPGSFRGTRSLRGLKHQCFPCDLQVRLAGPIVKVTEMGYQDGIELSCLCTGNSRRQDEAETARRLWVCDILDEGGKRGMGP